MKTTVFLTTVFLSAITIAAGSESAGGHHDAALPLDKIGWQAANLGTLLIAIFFLIRKSVAETFSNRQKDFINNAEKTKAALKEAEAVLSETKARLAELEAGEKKSIDTAQKDAEIMQAKLVKDAEAQAEKIKTDAQMMIRAELDKAKNEINSLVMELAVKSATQKISQNVSQNTQSAEAQFIKQISQVTP